jgi:myo-inositol catabolism protein IolC
MDAIQRADSGHPGTPMGILVDEQYGASVARKARSADNPLAIPVEKSGQAEFDFEYGAEFGGRIDQFPATFAKVLVRYNPDADEDLNRRQTERLTRLSVWLHDRNRLFLFELLVRATPGQLRWVGGDRRRYDAQIRPRRNNDLRKSCGWGGFGTQL